MTTKQTPITKKAFNSNKPKSNNITQHVFTLKTPLTIPNTHITTNA